MSIKKSSIQEALIDAREIEKSALDKARKALEEELAPKIRQVATDALRELEQEAINEDVTIKISTDGGEKVETSDDEIKTPETLGNETETSDNLEGGSSEENNNIENIDEMGDIFEISGLDEVDETPQPEAGAAPEVAPTEVPSPEGAESPEGTSDAPIDAETPTLETINQKLDDVLAKLGGESEEGEEGGEGTVEIEDNPEAPAAETPAAETPAPTAGTPAPAPLQEFGLDEDLFEYELEEDDNSLEEVVYECEDNVNEELDEEVIFEFEDAENESVNEDLSEIEIVSEDFLEEENELEEMHGHGLEHSTLGNLPGEGAEYRKINESINKIKAQYGSKNDELSKENVSLKQTIKEYKESFVVLRKQINEVQIFNAKLAYANKLFTNGGLTNDEKIKIAEDFDRVQTIEEAKKLYNTFLSEMKISKSPKITSIEKLKSAGPAVISSSSNTQTLFESDEMRRMKRLAGISKKTEE